MSILSNTKVLTLHTKACRKCKAGPLCTIGAAYMRPINNKFNSLMLQMPKTVKTCAFNDGCRGVTG
jgi:hypothetical protein